MALSDQELLDFNDRNLMGLDKPPRELLAEHGDAYRYQLVAAHWIEQWAGRVEGNPAVEEATSRAYVNALLEVTALLRQGDFLPGGSAYDEMNPDAET